MEIYSKAQRASVGGGDGFGRSCGVSRLDHVGNDRIRDIINVENTIMDTVERKRPKRIWQCAPQEEDVAKAIATRFLNEKHRIPQRRRQP